jgi:hypothetical protein
MSTINSTELSIDTVTPAITIGEVMVSADRRGKDIADTDRIRRVVIPAGTWGELTGSSNGTTSQGLTDILVTGLKAVASARLRDYLQEQPLARTVALTDYSITSLLAWSVDTASSRGALTFDRDDVIAWFPASAIYKAMAARGKQYVEFMGNRLAALAAKNHGLKNPEDATKLVTLLGDDVETPLGSELIQRLAHIERSLTARKEATTIGMDDL